MLPALETLWCQYLDASTKIVYPARPGDIRVTLLTSATVSRTLYRASCLIELWANPDTSEAEAIALHAKALMADSQYRLGANLLRVEADIPRPSPDPDSDLDRYQFIVSYHVRTLPV